MDELKRMTMDAVDIMTNDAVKRIEGVTVMLLDGVPDASGVGYKPDNIILAKSPVPVFYEFDTTKQIGLAYLKKEDQRLQALLVVFASVITGNLYPAVGGHKMASDTTDVLMIDCLTLSRAQNMDQRIQTIGKQKAMVVIGG